MKNNLSENTDIVVTFKFDNIPIIFTFRSNIKIDRAKCEQLNVHFLCTRL